MYPDLSYFFNDLFGTDVDNWTAIFKTFGLFLALAFFAAAYILKLEFKRKESEGLLHPVDKKIVTGPQNVWGEILSNTLLFFILAWKLPFIARHFTEFKQDPASIVFNLNGDWLIGIFIALGMFGYSYYKNKERLHIKEETRLVKVYPHQKIGDITIVAAISGIIGARFFSILENLDSFYSDPLGQIFSGSGLTVYGGVIVATFVVLWYVSKNGISKLHMMDAGALSLLMGYIVGRMGCQFSGDGDWGIPNSAEAPSGIPQWLWSYDYPHNITKQGQKMVDCIGEYCNHLVPGVYPTPVYEIFMCGLIFAGLWMMRKRITIPGMMFFLYLIFSGIERYLIEFIRVNDKYEFLGFNYSQGQWIALASVLIGIVGSILLWQRSKNHSTL